MTRKERRAVVAQNGGFARLRREVRMASIAENAAARAADMFSWFHVRRPFAHLTDAQLAALGPALARLEIVLDQIEEVWPAIPNYRDTEQDQ